MTPGYRTEFPDFDPATLPAIPPTWVDRSWQDDGCPCWQSGTGHLVFIDYADTAERTFPYGPRFVVVTDLEFYDNSDIVLESDDWDAVLEFLASITRTAPAYS